MTNEELVDLWDDVVTAWNRVVDALRAVMEKIRAAWDALVDVIADLTEDELEPVPPANVKDLRRPPRNLFATEAPRGLRTPRHYARRNR